MSTVHSDFLPKSKLWKGEMGVTWCCWREDCWCSDFVSLNMIYFYALTLKNLTTIPAILKCGIALPCLCVCVCVCSFMCWVLQVDENVLSCSSCLILCDPMDCSLPDFSVHGISQARTLEWGAVSYSRGSSQPRDGTCLPFVSRCILHH